MADYTENLNLKKPTDDDFYNIDDFNGNADILDGEISKKADISAMYDGDFVLTTLKGKNITVEISEEERLLSVTYVNSDNSLVIRNFRLLRTNDKIYASMLDVTPEQLEAAPAVHTHSASDITSGTLPIARGGTEASTVDGALNNLGLKGVNITFTPTQSNCTGFAGTLKAIPALRIVIIDGVFTLNAHTTNNGYILGSISASYASKNTTHTPLQSTTDKFFIQNSNVFIKPEHDISADEKISVSGFWCY